MLVDDLTLDTDEVAGRIVQQRPSEVQYDALCDEFGDEAVALVHRCFYLRAWKKVHGNYPYVLEYLMLRALLALDEEMNLREAKETFDAKENQRRMESDMRAQSGKIHRPPGGSGQTF